MHLILQKISPKLIKNSQNFFWEDFCNELKKQKPWTYNESLVARYLIKNSPLLIKERVRGWSSISHKKNLVFVWISKEKIWVDVEILKKRDENLLEKFKKEEYGILDWKNCRDTPCGYPCYSPKNWENFYILWTAKEAIIKYENLKLDNIEEIILENVEMFGKNISWLNFEKKLFLRFKNKNFIVYSWKKDDLIFWVCNLSNLW